MPGRVLKRSRWPASEEICRQLDGYDRGTVPFGDMRPPASINRQTERLRNRVERIIAGSVQRDDSLVRQAIGHSEAWQRRDIPLGDLESAEFRVFSQWNEDGIIQHLIRHITIADHSFIEFGVQDYRESNTHFLLTNDNWRGLIIDPAEDANAFIAEELAWSFELTCLEAMVTRENINNLFRKGDFVGDIGLLSIDVDGMDYWLWEACEVVRPRIVVCEYNATLGLEHMVTVPYQPDFYFRDAHPSALYHGASLPALIHLAARKEYEFVGCESHGANAFFVRADVNSLPTRTAEDGYRYNKYRLYKGLSDRNDRLSVIKDMPLEDVVTGQIRTIGDLYGV